MAIAKKATKKSVVKPAKPAKKTSKQPVAKPTETKKAVKKVAPKIVTPKKVAYKVPSKIAKTYSKSELLTALSTKASIGKKEAGLVLEGLEELIHAHLKKGGPEKFVLPGILKVVVKNVPARKARPGRNPLTGEEIMLKAKPASKKVKVVALKNLKSVV